MTPQYRLFRMRARHWKWRRHFLVLLFCFAFGVGLSGDVKWLRSEPEIAVIDLEASFITMYAPIADSVTFVLPMDAGKPGQCLRSDGTGVLVLSWGDCTGGGGSGAVTSALASGISSGTISATALATTATPLLSANVSASDVRVCSNCGENLMPCLAVRVNGKWKC